MAYRPFIKKSMAELEQKFEMESGDPSFRKLLGEELQHRTTQKAERLKKRLAAIEEASQKPSQLSASVHDHKVAISHKNSSEESAETIPDAAPVSPAKTVTADPALIEPMILDLPPVTDNTHSYSKPEAVLNAWTAMEVLSPATFRKPETLCDGNPRSVIRFSNGMMPWQDGLSCADIYFSQSKIAASWMKAINETASLL